MFGHKRANFRTCFKNESVLKMLQSAEFVGTNGSAMVYARHFDHGH